jgi:hypothetical protein
MAWDEKEIQVSFISFLLFTSGSFSIQYWGYSRGIEREGTFSLSLVIMKGRKKASFQDTVFSH